MARSPPPTSNLSDLERQEMWQRPRWAAAKLDFQELKFKNTSTPGTRDSFNGGYPPKEVNVGPSP